MGVLSIGDSGMQLVSLQDFSGGMALPCVNDNEFEQFLNFDTQRDGVAISRLGAWQLNANSLGSDAVYGLGQAAAGNTVYTIVAKNNTGSWYAAALPTATSWNPTVPVAQTFTAFSNPTSQKPGSPVRMESVIDTAGTNQVVFVASAMQPWMWSGSATAELVAAPVAQYARWYQGQLYLAGLANPFSVQYSEVSDPTTWPSANQFYIDARFGPIQGMEITPVGLMFFCQYGLVLMSGVPPNQYLQPMHDRIGCLFPDSISTCGNVTMFVGDGAIYQFAGNVTTMTDRLFGISPLGNYAQGQTAGLTTRGQTGVLLPSYYMLAWGEAIATSPALTYVLPRRRPGTILMWSYPKTTDLGAGTLNGYAVAAPFGDNAVLRADNAGNVYVQPLRNYTAMVENLAPTDMPVTNYPAAAPSGYTRSVPPFFTPDNGPAYGPQAVQSVLRTRWLDMGSSAMVKRLRRVSVYGRGDGVLIIVRLRHGTHVAYAGAGNTTTDASNLGWNQDDPTRLYPYTHEFVATNRVLPTRVDVSLDAMPACFVEMQVDVIGNAMQIKGIDVVWDPLRFATDYLDDDVVTDYGAAPFGGAT